MKIINLLLILVVVQLSGEVVTPNGASLEWVWEGNVKAYKLTIEEIDWEFAPGMKARCWGYNGRTPGPTIEAIEGDRVRFYVTNKLPEPTVIHWHGILLPNEMDGVAGLTQRAIATGETFIYEFTLNQNGTQMYHSHADEMIQIGLGTMGFFVIHPKEDHQPKVDRDYAIFLSEWSISPGTSRPDPSVMTDFNIFTFNSRVFPGTDPLLARTGERVRIRFGNVSQEDHPIHIHGVQFEVTGTDAGRVPESARYKETTVIVGAGQTRDIEFVAAAPGDWPIHCHRRHHPMNAMGHDIPNAIGVNTSGLSEKIRELLPGTMLMGEHGMHDMGEMQMTGPENTLPMMGGIGPFGSIGMGGMFTLLKVRDQLEGTQDPGWYQQPPAESPKPSMPSGHIHGGS